MPSVQLNTRIDSGLKERGDRVLARRGFTPSGAVRALWAYADAHGDVPPFMLDDSDEAKAAQCLQRMRRAQEGFGMAVRMASELGADTLALEEVLGSKDWRELRDEMYDECLNDFLARTEGSLC